MVDAVGTTGKRGVRTRLWRNGSLVCADFPFEEISDHIDTEGNLVWVDLCDPEPDQLRELAEELTLDPLAVEDSLSKAGRAKATRYATHTFVTAYAAWIDVNDPDDVTDDTVRQARVSAFVMKRAIVTVRWGARFDVDELLRRWDDNGDLIKYGVGALVYGLLDMIVDSHFEAVQALDDSIELLEDALFDEQAQSRVMQKRTYRVRRDLVDLRRIVLPMREVVNSVLRHRREINAPTELDSWYDDLYDHVLRVSEWTESLRDMVSTIFETNLSLQDARLNSVMKKLTGWAAIIAVPTAVTGYFGQNIPYPGFGQEWGFVLSCLVIAGIAFVLYLSFKRRDWL
jgi:magnesium transporter